jgi:hypothetical protein
MTTHQIKENLIDTTDGTVDKFIIISRACALCAQFPEIYDNVANALLDELDQYDGPYPSTEFN